MHTGAKVAIGIGGLLLLTSNARAPMTSGGGGRLEDIADAIEKMEGYYPGSLAYTNNNPGNLRYVGQTAFGGISGITLGQGNFSKFGSYADGRKALLWQILEYARRGVTFRQFLASYAPSSDNNDPENYANFVADWIGAEPDELLSVWV